MLGKISIEDLVEQGLVTVEILEPAELESVWASDVEIEALDWLWPDRFALGKLGLLVGLADVGKGNFLCDTIARITTGGAWPCGEGAASLGNVVWLQAEDSLSDTATPRLKAAGADLNRVRFVKMVRDGAQKRSFSLLTDLPRLQQLIEQSGDVKLIVVDPITAYLGVRKLDSYRATDVRGVLAPLTELAEAKHLAVIAVMHFNKKIDVTNALLRVSDSAAFGAVARHCYGIIEDAEHERQLFVRAKNNLAKRSGVRTLAFHFQERDVGQSARTGKRVIAPYIVWATEPVDISATEAMEAANTAGANISARGATKEFLQNRLSAGPVSQKDIEAEAEANMISRATLRRAKEDLGIVAYKEKGKLDGVWLWKLP